jgi:hypothetical protein
MTLPLVGKTFILETWNNYNDSMVSHEELEINLSDGKLLGKYNSQHFGAGGNWETPELKSELWELEFIEMVGKRHHFKIKNLAYPPSVFIDAESGTFDFY